MSFINEQQQKKHFDINKNQYNISWLTKPRYHTLLELKKIFNKLKNINREYTIVDFGSGTGRVAIFILKKNYQVIAVDVSKNSLNNLKKVAESLNLKKLRLFTSLPKDEKFKAIIGSDILHHINLKIYLPKIYNSLQKNGKVIFSEPGAYNLSWYFYLSIFHDWQIEKGLTQCSYFNLIKQLKIAGFNKIKIEGLGLLPAPFFDWFKPLCRLNDWLGSLPFLKLFAYRYIIEAYKQN